MGHPEIDLRLTIRKMQESDLKSVYEIEKNTHVQPWSWNIICECYQSDYLCLVAIKEKTLCGYIILSKVIDESHLLNLCVSTEQQGSGIGHDLVREGISQVSRTGANKMFLEVRRSNLPAIGLYQSLGFVEIGVRSNYYQGSCLDEDALVFVLSIE